MNKFIRFMYGRYGIDELYKFCLVLYIIIVIINLFLKNNILNIVSLVILILMFYRMLSKDIYGRRKENNFYLKIKDILLKPFKNVKRNFEDRHDYVYKKCHKCKTILRLPLPMERGIKHTKCPECKNKIAFLCLRKQKIEIITNKERMKKC